MFNSREKYCITSSIISIMCDGNRMCLDFTRRSLLRRTRIYRSKNSSPRTQTTQRSNVFGRNQNNKNNRFQIKPVHCFVAVQREHRRSHVLPRVKVISGGDVSIGFPKAEKMLSGFRAVVQKHKTKKCLKTVTVEFSLTLFRH